MLAQAAGRANRLRTALAARPGLHVEKRLFLHWHALLQSGKNDKPGVCPRHVRQLGKGPLARVCVSAEAAKVRVQLTIGTRKLRRTISLLFEHVPTGSGERTNLLTRPTARTPKDLTLTSAPHRFWPNSPHLVDPMRRILVAAVPQIVDQEHANSRDRQEGFTRPLLDQVRRGHCQSCEWLSVAVDMNRSQRNQSLARSAFGHNHGGSRPLPCR
jgi:hypothetical protein